MRYKFDKSKYKNLDAIGKKHVVIRKNSTMEKRVWERDGGTCIYCGNPADVLDHVIRFLDNSPTKSNNLVCCCYKCNSYRGRYPRDVVTLTKAIFWLSTHGEDVSWMDNFYPKPDNVELPPKP